ncbi:hypothetical protein MKX08_000372 [Trichoderma sp. CBMAI-0020]|nr:hypothetical protein MKX08_000372 [Trichoderma sp. CBMAI-0020]
MERGNLKRGLKNFQGKLRGWLRPEDQNDTSSSHVPASQKQISAIPRSDEIPINELWNIAYEKLRAEDGTLIEEYEKKLQGNMVAGLGSMLNTNMRDQMQTILENKMSEVNANTWKLKFRSSEVEVRDIVQPILGAVNLVNQYITDGVSVSPYTSLAWAGISLLLPLFLNPSTQMASLAKGLEFVSALIAQSRMREELYIRRYGLNTREDQPLQRSHHEYKNGLERLYRQILRFQVKAYCYFTDNSASRFCLDIMKQNDWDQLIDGVSEQEALFEKLSATWRDIQYDNDCLAARNQHQETMKLWFTIGANVANLERAIQEAQYQQNRIDLLNWLCDIDHTELYNSARHHHTVGTGMWFIHQEKIFQAWEKSLALRSFLWLHGKAGSGKSILSSCVIKHLQGQHKSNATNVLAYFYFSFSDSKKQNVDGMLSSLIRQISSRRPHIPQAVQSLEEHKNRGGRPDTEALIEALIASMQGFSAVYIIVDALDECLVINGERKKLFSCLRHILEAAPDSLHMLCTSRKEVDIDKAMRPLLLKPWGEEIDLSKHIETLNDDIAQYIDSILVEADFDTWPKTHCWPRFQYIRCQFENLQKLSSMDAIRKALQDLPSGLDLTYDRMLHGIDEDFQSQVIASLKWLACSAEPLTIGLLAEIFVLPSSPNNGFEEISSLFSPMDVLKYFPGLIVIQENKNLNTLGSRKEDPHVRLAHFSIKEYLMSDRIFQSPVSGFAFTESDAHMHIADLCLAYHLHMSTIIEISDSNRLRLGENELKDYASRNWAEHLEMVSRTSWSPKILRNAALSLSIRSQSLKIMVSCDYQCDEDFMRRPHCYTARRGFRQLTGMLVSGGAGVNRYITQMDLDEGLHYATKSRKKSIAKLFLDNGARMHNCLEEAAEQGDIGLVQLLLDHGAETNSLTGKLEPALRAALWGGYLDVLKLLYSRGADINSPFATAKQAHVPRNSELRVADCLRFLFDNGAGVDLNVDRSLTAALYVAIRRGYQEVPQLLIDRGASLNELAGQDGYPLEVALRHSLSNDRLIRRLLDLGADPNAQGGKYGTALQAACGCQSVILESYLAKAIEVLTNKGADVSFQGGKYGTALQAACWNSIITTSTIQLLLDKGAEVNAQGGYYGNALQAACQRISSIYRKRNLEIPKLLLSRGANVNAEGGYYGTALQAACAKPHYKGEGMVSLLISSGADVNTQGGRHGTALQAACKFGNLEVVRLLLKEGALVNVEGGHHGTALQAACAEGHIEVVRLLLEHGADIHLRSNGAWHAAAQACNDDVTRLLLDLGVDMNDRHGPHGTALHAALRMGWNTSTSFWNLGNRYQLRFNDFLSWERRIRLLIRRGADPNLVAGEYGTALQTVCALKLDLSPESKNAYPGAAASEFLLEICPGIDVNAHGGLFGSALQAAAYSGQTPTVVLLLNKGARINACGGKYGSALNAAVIAGNWDTVQILLDAGAVPDCHTLSEPDEEWLRSVLEDEDDGQGAVERYRKFWEVEMASQADKEKGKA